MIVQNFMFVQLHVYVLIIVHIYIYSLNPAFFMVAERTLLTPTLYI